ncbi:hypothetical protein GDO78_012812 [Eleutherodactylus coqui]|uniref:Uncharacterized protein n=1 Tax=Eleutherodactylus coqui TaxID=57060 RepID=A0A8J6K3A5_ELECQ|nr:hypothetical protein GDO78_012812 [Eleutherodactylus coqui]
MIIKTISPNVQNLRSFCKMQQSNFSNTEEKCHPVQEPNPSMSNNLGNRREAPTDRTRPDCSDALQAGPVGLLLMLYGFPPVRPPCQD